MKKQIKSSSLGSFSNDGLGSGLGFSEWSEEDLKQAETYITKIHERIWEIFDKEIYRLENILKDRFRILPKSEDFAIWYFDNLPIKKQNEPIKITDKEIIDYIKIYLQQFEKLLDTKSSKEINNLKSFNWIGNSEKLYFLYIHLIENEYIARETIFDTFKYIFSENDLKSITSKIIWLKYSRNRKLNKKSISDLIIVLQENKLIEEVKDNFPKILSNCFKSKNNELKFTHSNLSNSNGYSEYRTELEKIIKYL